MPKSVQSEIASPSTSSLFLPLGRLARRDSRSSLSPAVDRDALNEALDNIHSAASQSQVLTVFNEYTDPPNIHPESEGKGLAVELQDGLSGFYNRLKASVGVGKDDVEINPKVSGRRTNENTGDLLSFDGKTQSGPTSRPGSPRNLEVDMKQAGLVRSQNSKPSSRSSISTIPTIKSPSVLSHNSINFLSDPIVAEINVHATRKSTGVSKQEVSNKRMQDGTFPDPDQSTEPRRMASKNRKPESADYHSEPPLLSPSSHTEFESQDLARLSERAQLDPVSRMHQAGESRSYSDDAPDSIKRAEAFNLSQATDGRVFSAVSPGPEPQKASIEPSKQGQHLNPRGPDIPRRQPSPRLPWGVEGHRLNTRTKISPSRLPGFQASRASSTDSSARRSNVPVVDAKQSTSLDGPHDRRPVEPREIYRDKSRSKLLNREFWMRDENAKDCFHCGEPFSTFRRKHHCRTCGQIFDSKCTSLIDGSQFGSTNSVRVCKPCQAIIAAQDDDSSEYSGEDRESSNYDIRPRTPIPERELRKPPVDDDSVSVLSQSLEQMSKTPTMSFPLRRAAESNHRSSAVLEFDAADHFLPRPSSSKSLRTSHSIPYGHKRYNSRHQHVRNFKSYHDERAPFQKRLAEDAKQDQNQSAFHRDSVIDPDLAQYLSDDPSSEEEGVVQLELNGEKLARNVAEHEKPSIGGLLAAVRKGRSRIGEKSIASFLSIGREGDDASIISSRSTYHPRPSRKRNFSFSSTTNQRTTPRTTRENLHLVIPGSGDRGRPVSPSPALPIRRSRIIRSASIQGMGPASIELNRASLQHVHKLLKQLLVDTNVPQCSNWESALVPILLRATDDVDPDVQGGDDMDIRNYVKLKRIPGGKPADTSYVSGLVFTKNIALKSMSRFVANPRILLISFPIEYARYEQHFMSLDPVIRQEREYLKNLVGMIAALKPHILLAQRNVSGLALELLDKENIVTAYNVKSTVVEAVSRCTQSRIVHSVDKLAAQPSQLGTCDSFEVKTFASDGRKKTYIYLSGCLPHLGCTIVLRGAGNQTLAKVKRITEFMIYAVYNLKLETCLMRDEWALIPNTDTQTPDTSFRGGYLSKVENLINSKAKLDKTTPDSSHDGKSNSATGTLLGDSDGEIVQVINSHGSTQSAGLGGGDGTEIPDDIPVPTFYEDLVEKHQTKILSASPYVKFLPPYLLMRARELERRVAYLKRLRDQDLSEELSPEDKSKPQKFTLIQPEMVHSKLTGAGRRVKEIVHAVHDAEYDKALHNYETQKKMWESYISGNRNLFDPYAHQNIVVLFSFVATETSVPCSGPDLLAFRFYNEHENDADFEADCTLGQYVEDLCYRANEVCSSAACEKLLHEHHRQYVHGEAQVSVFVQPQAAKLPGLQNSILMWSQCRICGVETTVTPMSVSTWKYSFGKYLELSFWSADLRARAGVCHHDLHRDHLRFFGYNDFVLRFQYDPIDLLEIIVPRLRITWKVDNDLKFRNDVYARIERRMTKFMGSVKYRLKSMKIDAVLPENIETCRFEIEKLTKKANDDHTQLIRQLQDRYSNSKHWETIPLNRAIRSTLEKVTEWENLFNDFEKRFLPSENDILRLATLQLQKIFLDRDVSVTSLAPHEDAAPATQLEPPIDEKSPLPSNDQEIAKGRRATVFSPEKTHDVLKSVVEEQASLAADGTGKSSPETSKLLSSTSEVFPNSHTSPKATDLPHLDLAVSSSAAKQPSQSSTSPPRGPRIKTPVIIVTPKVEDQASVTAESQDFPSAANNLIPQPPVPKEPPYASTPSMRRQASDALKPREQVIKVTPPPLFRAQSQPAGSSVIRRERSNLGPEGTSEKKDSARLPEQTSKPALVSPISTKESATKKSDRSLSERFGLGHLRTNKSHKGHSLIPRAVPNGNESRVSNLAKHFEQLSREFEKERIREKKQRAARHRQSRVYPLAASKPIVEVYRNVDEAVQEKDTSEVLFQEERPEPRRDSAASHTIFNSEDAEPSERINGTPQAEQAVAEASETEPDVHETSRTASDTEVENEQSDEEGDLEEIRLPDSPEDLLRLSQEDLDFKELQKHDRSSLMRILTNFWAERSSSGWTPLEMPVRPLDHIFTDCDIIVREDEPSSIIAFALNSQDYKSMLHEIQGQTTGIDEQLNSHHSISDDSQADLLHSLLRKTGTHLKYQFEEGPAKMLCKIFFAEQFDAVRRKCGISDRIVESLSRCMKWDSKGGKTKSLFLKTLDDRFVLKSLSPIETQSFLKFAPNYFQIMSEAFFHELPSVIAKMLGFYQIIIKNPVTGLEYNWFLLVMENLFYDRIPTRIFDLKGSMRNRKIQSTGERNEVLLDENMVEFIYESPLFTRGHSKKLLKSSVHNDTLFLARQNVMDYSLMVAIDEKRKELVVGIIDCIRTYTWDKKLESWIKDRGFAGGNKNRPTVTSPKEYKKRFREAMGRYILEAPSCWNQFVRPTVERRVLPPNVVAPEGGQVEKADEQAEVLA